MVEDKEIPTGWNECELGKLFKERPKSKIQVSEASNHGDYPFFTSGEKVLVHNEYLIEGENLFLSTGGVANVKFFEGKCAYSTDTYAIYVDEDSNAKYLYYFILQKLYYINNNYFLGSGLKHLQKKDFKQHEIFLPSDITEQQKIAEVLTKVDKAITQTQQLIAKYKRIKTGLMQDLLTKGIDKNGNIRSEATHDFKDSPLGHIPVEWKVKPLYKVSEIVSGVTLGNKFEGLKTIELPYLRVANVQDGYLDLSEIKKIKVPFSYIDKYRLLKGDVLMNEGGDNDKLGRGTIWEEQIEVCLHQNHVYRVRPNSKIIMPNFLAYISSSDFAKSFFLKSSKQSTNLASISKTQLEIFPIAVPRIDEQERILDYIRKVDLKISISEKNLLKSQSLKQGLMQDLLSGKTRVTSLLKNTSL